MYSLLDSHRINSYNSCPNPVVTVLDEFRSRNYDRPDLDGFLVFGSDGRRELIAFDMRSGHPGPIVTIDLVAGSESAGMVSTSFHAFLGLVGLAR